MSAIAIQLEYAVGTETGDQAIGKLAVAFERAGEEVKDFGTHVFPRMVPIFEAELDAQFSAEGRGPIAGTWAALSTEYRKWKEANYPGRTKLVREGTLRAALTSTTSKSLRTTTRDTFDFGTVGIPYASFHQVGTPWMPARPPFDFGAEFERKFQKEAQLGIIDAVRAAGLEAEESP